MLRVRTSNSTLVIFWQKMFHPLHYSLQFGICNGFNSSSKVRSRMNMFGSTITQGSAYYACIHMVPANVTDCSPSARTHANFDSSLPRDSTTFQPVHLQNRNCITYYFRYIITSHANPQKHYHSFSIYTFQ